MHFRYQRATFWLTCLVVTPVNWECSMFNWTHISDVQARQRLYLKFDSGKVTVLGTQYEV